MRTATATIALAVDTQTHTRNFKKFNFLRVTVRVALGAVPVGHGRGDKIRSAQLVHLARLRFTMMERKVRGSNAGRPTV